MNFDSIISCFRHCQKQDEYDLKQKYFFSSARNVLLYWKQQIFFFIRWEKKIIISCKNKHGWIWHLIYQKCYHKAFLRLHIIPPEICCTLMVLQEGFWPGKKSLFSGTQVPPVSQIDTVQRLRDGKTKCAEKMFMMTRLYASLMNRNLCRVRL